MQRGHQEVRLRFYISSDNFSCRPIVPWKLAAGGHAVFRRQPHQFLRLSVIVDEPSLDSAGRRHDDVGANGAVERTKKYPLWNRARCVTFVHCRQLPFRQSSLSADQKARRRDCLGKPVVVCQESAGGIQVKGVNAVSKQFTNTLRTFQLSSSVVSPVDECRSQVNRDNVVARRVGVAVHVNGPALLQQPFPRRNKVVSRVN